MAATNSGYIKLFRSLADWEWYDDTVTMRVWIHLLIKANYEDKRWHGVEIKRGQLITSIEKLATELCLSKQQVRTALRNLQSSGEITRQPTNRWTLINIEKYNEFQGGNLSANTPANTQTTHELTNSQQTNNTQATTTKEYKEINKERKKNNTRSRARKPSSFEEILDELRREYELEESGDGQSDRTS